MEVFIVTAENRKSHQSFNVQVVDSEDLAKEMVYNLTRQEPSGSMSKRINESVHDFSYEIFDVKGEKD